MAPGGDGNMFNCKALTVLSAAIAGIAGSAIAARENRTPNSAAFACTVNGVRNSQMSEMEKRMSDNRR